ncbi:MAG: hypothetical protein JW850_19310 [Thermoflexales bacterium]|nr:hypothetical protein [Thermoflexales bacterium]
MNKSGLAALAVIVSLLVAVGGLQAQTVPNQYFPDTGHNVRGEFLRFFNENGGVDIVGQPLTGEILQDGRQVQYFQNLRLDAYPENSTSPVQPGPLGSLLGRGDPPIPSSDIPSAGDPNRRYFPATGHTVSYAFLIFFNAHGGEAFFGWPITEFKSEGGRIVQYFERARMEWHPDLAPEQRVHLGDLGQVYASQRLSFDVLDPPPASPAQAVQVTALKPLASLHSAVTGRWGTQKLHVYVMDQRGQPVPHANVVAVVHFPGGDQELAMMPSDERGYTVRVFELGQLTPGQRVVISVRAGWGALSALTWTSFLVWW